MILTDEEIDARLPTITLKGMDPKQQVWLTKKDAIAFVRAAETAVIAKLCAGVEMPEPDLYAHELIANEGGIWLGLNKKGICEQAHVPGETGEEVREYYTAEQLQIAIAAARVKALEDAALNCEELHWIWRMGDNSGPKECAEKIRALKGTP